jgi:hypothetical protein
MTELAVQFLISIVTFQGVMLVNFGMVYFGIAFFRRIANI